MLPAKGLGFTPQLAILGVIPFTRKRSCFRVLQLLEPGMLPPQTAPCGFRETATILELLVTPKKFPFRTTPYLSTLWRF